MDFHLSLFSIIIILFLSFFLTILPPSYCNEDDPFVVCNRNYACGGVKIPFPFWGGTRPQYCGDEDHELTCVNNEYPVLGFEALDFRVLNINTSSRSFTIARSDLWDGPCPPKLLNTTLNLTLFDYRSNVQNITIFYGCPVLQDNNIPEASNSFNCSQGVGDGKINISYYLVDESPSSVQLHEQLVRDCDSSINVPILRSSASALLDDPQGGALAVQQAMDKGFEVEYNNRFDHLCRGCKETGGVCGSNSTRAFVCYCRDQVQSFTCPKQVELFAVFQTKFP
ncbi:LEAF RUST 10 DISEASE-RESISTANCE LOCUS RECEPTOR-LIKE PROTEIN KINASE-like 2.5 [Corylus avellana]|uniref:LEAF RUST 10 DISEASE-RESISTANCE LOCUS RECEPTOR-LIKE PROTEIN KINASE-like 2.5 n=1 Tax=Corylus avellana TaxID=13451 RepID=UPI00286BBAD5|nr:LEAF RUST 10 DISEASE-RESISTANCE LOCUS RECEPTOR-LIKE PROTEIN KINASE-like 2.5 [Corylus avellana]